MDEPGLQAALPERLAVEVEDVRIGLVHIPGARVGREARLVSWFPSCETVVYGHTHVPQLKRHRGVWILNPGSPTERRRAPNRSMALVEVKGARFEIRLLPLS